MKSFEFGKSRTAETESSTFNVRRILGRAAILVGFGGAAFLGSHASAGAEQLNIDQLNPGSVMQLENMLPPELTAAINSSLEQATPEQQQLIGDVANNIENTVYTFVPEVVPGDLDACESPNSSSYADIQCAVGQTEQFYQEEQGDEYIPATTVLSPQLGVGLTVNPENPTDFCGYAPIIGDHACDNTIFLTNPDLMKEPPKAEEYKWLVAHEWNHTVQENEGENVSMTLLKSMTSGDPMSDSSPFLYEQRSDCAAGAQALWSERMGYSDTAETARGAEYMADLSAGEDDMNHGTPEQRAAAFAHRDELASCNY